MNQQGMTVQEAAGVLQLVILDKATMTGRETDQARTALNRLATEVAVLDRIAQALKAAATAAGVDADKVIAETIQKLQGGQPQPQQVVAPPVAMSRAERRRKLEAVKPAKEAAAQE